MRTERRWRILVATAAAALGMVGTGGPAAAAVTYPFDVYHYSIIYRGSGTYALTGQGDGGALGQARASYHWRVSYDLLLEYHRGHQLGAIAKPGGRGAGTWSLSFSNVDDQSCNSAGGLQLNRYGALSGSVQRDGSLVIALFPGSNDYRTTPGSASSGPCDTTDFWRDWVEGFSQVGSGPPMLDPLTAVVLVKRRQLHDKRLSITVSNRSLFEPQLTIGSDCAPAGGSSCAQSFGWTGRVTLTKLARR